MDLKEDLKDSGIVEKQSVFFCWTDRRSVFLGMFY